MRYGGFGTEKLRSMAMLFYSNDDEILNNNNVVPFSDNFLMVNWIIFMSTKFPESSSNKPGKYKPHGHTTFVVLFNVNFILLLESHKSMEFVQT